MARELQRHRKGIGSIPNGGLTIDDEFFSTLPCLNFEMHVYDFQSRLAFYGHGNKSVPKIFSPIHLLQLNLSK